MSFETPWGNYLLDKIVETTTPNSISFWPQTLAWQFIFIVLVVFILKKSYQAWKTYQNNAYRREAIVWLSQCSLNNEDDIRQLPALLRKTALLANEITREEAMKFGDLKPMLNRHHEITKLTGNAWASWLDKHCDKSHFSHAVKPEKSLSCEILLTQLAYLPTIDLNNVALNQALKELHQQITFWVLHHNITTELVHQNSYNKTKEKTV